MSFHPHLWNQLKNLTADDLMRALAKDGWNCDKSGGSMHIYRHKDGRRVSIHYHPRKTYGPNLLKSLLNDCGWSEERMRELKLLR